MLSDDWERPPAIISKYYLYQATTTYGFFWPVFTVFLLGRGLSFAQIGVLGSISAALVVVGEIPTGYVGDRIGRRNSLVVGALLQAASVFGFVLAQSFLAFAGLWVFWGLGSAFQSGSGDAWLYETLAERLDEAAFTRVRGRGGSVNQWLTAATMLAAGGLYSIDSRLPFVAGGLLLTASVPVLASMPQTEHHTDSETLAVFDALPVVKRQLSRPPLRSTVAYLALFFGVLAAVDEYIQPIATNAVGIPESGLGPLYAGFTVAAAVASYYASDLESLLSTRWAIVLVPVLVGAFLVVPLAAPVAALPTFFLVKSARTAVTPIANGYINDHVDAVGRATVLSGASMAYALVRLPLKPASGVLADATAPLTTLAALGVLLLVGGGLLLAWEQPAIPATEGTAGAGDGRS